MRVAITGVTGLIGSALRASLEADDHEVMAISRRDEVSSLRTVTWDVTEQSFDPAPLEGIDAVIHLAGEPIDQRWTESVKQKIRNSRIESTRLLVRGIGSLREKPRVLVCASAVGYYGDRGDAGLDESSPAGEGFLPEVCQAWESAAAEVEKLGVRRVSVRNGVVLSTEGGALGRMLLPFRLGLGGRVGDGRQWMSWIHIDDTVRIFRLALQREDLNGPINGTAPDPVRNAEFAQQLGRALHRPAVLPVPAFALKLIFGEMSRILLESQRVDPRAAREAGLDFRYAELSAALAELVGDGA